MLHSNGTLGKPGSKAALNKIWVVQSCQRLFIRHTSLVSNPVWPKQNFRVGSSWQLVFILLVLIVSLYSVQTISYIGQYIKPILPRWSHSDLQLELLYKHVQTFCLAITPLSCRPLAGCAGLLLFPVKEFAVLKFQVMHWVSFTVPEMPSIWMSSEHCLWRSPEIGPACASESRLLLKGLYTPKFTCGSHTKQSWSLWPVFKRFKDSMHRLQFFNGFRAPMKSEVSLSVVHLFVLRIAGLIACRPRMPTALKSSSFYTKHHSKTIAKHNVFNIFRSFSINMVLQMSQFHLTVSMFTVQQPLTSSFADGEQRWFGCKILCLSPRPCPDCQTSVFAQETSTWRTRDGHVTDTWRTRDGHVSSGTFSTFVPNFSLLALLLPDTPAIAAWSECAPWQRILPAAPVILQVSQTFSVVTLDTPKIDFAHWLVPPVCRWCHPLLALACQIHTWRGSQRQSKAKRIQRNWKAQSRPTSPE